MSQQFDKGDRVMTHLGPGTVVSRRMDHLGDINQVACYSVCLDHKKEESEKPPFRTYTGTTIPAENVQQEEKCCVCEKNPVAVITTDGMGCMRINVGACNDPSCILIRMREVG